MKRTELGVRGDATAERRALSLLWHLCLGTVAVVTAVVLSFASLAVSAGASASKRPGPPTNVAVVSGNGSLSVSWSAPSSLGGGPITGYQLRPIGGKYCSPNGQNDRFLATSCNVSGLRNGKTYNVWVQAFNAYGGSGWYTSLPATATVGTPSAPTNVTATFGNASASLTWTAPSGNGSPIVSYTATGNPGGQQCTSASTSCTVSALTNGESYTFVVTATNKVTLTKKSSVLDSGPASLPSAAVIPATVPGPPTGVTLKAGSLPGDEIISWGAPATNEGRNVLGYAVTSAPNTGNCNAGLATSCTISGLAAGKNYTFTVKANNVVGPSTGASATVFPVGCVPATNVDLAGCDFAWTNLAGLALYGDNLTGADLAGANFTGTNLSYDNLSGINLNGVDLTGANLTGISSGGVTGTAVDFPPAGAWSAATWSVRAMASPT